MENKKIFFNGLNELRAFAALSVIFHHIELFKNSDHINSLLDSIYFSYFIEKLGKNGVYLFFVLSGFLITYLLLLEKGKLNSCVYLFVFSLTILLSHFSYKYFESIFINIKDNKYKSL
jgi:peptidoglycan/LPS O-acetylase OafA/YrhL